MSGGEELQLDVLVVMERSKEMRKEISLSLRYKIYGRDNFTCQYCFRQLPKTLINSKSCKYINKKTIEHIVPVLYGGTNEEDNLILVCAPCNTKRAAIVIYPNGSHPDKKTYLDELRKIIKL